MSLRLFKLTINKEKLRAESDIDVGGLRDFVVVCAKDEKQARNLRKLDERWPESRVDPDSETVMKTHLGQDTSDPTTLWDNPKYVTCNPYEGTKFPCNSPGIVYPPEKKDE